MNDLLAAIVGLAVGSFLNVLAVRTLKEESLFSPPSHCRCCQHRLGASELVPVVSYFWLKGKCKQCQGPIPWHYPVVEVVTAFLFVLITRRFGCSLYGAGMLFFASTLIAVSITDFMEKLIPHEITYPAMLLGIVFSINLRHDFWSTLAGIGTSYILIDFMAFYGLKIYLWLHTPVLESSRQQLFSFQPEGRPRAMPSLRRSIGKYLSIEPASRLKMMQGTDWQKTGENQWSEGQSPEEIEVIGGGDAVLYALVSAWLGLNCLIFTIVVSFLIGSVMGGAYLLYDMWRQRLLPKLVRPVLIGLSSLVALISCFLGAIASVSGQSFWQTPWYILLPAAALCGSLLGVIWVGGRLSKPFPFGPAIAIGAAMAMFNCQANNISGPGP